MNWLKRTVITLFCLFLLLSMGGCQKPDTDTKLVLYTGFKKDEVFRIETMSCMLPEIMVYLTNTQDQYESVFGKEIWKTDLCTWTLCTRVGNPGVRCTLKMAISTLEMLCVPYTFVCNLVTL